MSKRDRKGLRTIDWVTASLFFGLMIVGWLMIFAVGFDEKNAGDIVNNYLLNFKTTIGKQTLWMGIAFLLLLIILVIDVRFWYNFSYPIYIAGLLLLLAVLFFGEEIKGAKSWFVFGGFSFQPSEIAKMATALAVSSYLSAYNTDLKNIWSQVTAIGLFLIPIGFILMQPDAGSAIVFMSFLIVLYRAGMPSIYYLLLIAVISLFVLSFVFDPLIVTMASSLLISLILVFNLKRRFYWLLLYFSLAAAVVIAYYQGFINEGVITSFALLPFLLFVHIQQRSGRLAFSLLISLGLGIAFIFSTNYAFENFLQPHQQDRLNVWLRPDLCDPQGALYNVIQSKMAIGSGGFEGKGFLQGTLTKLKYVPEQTTDFIFCTIGEEQGFIGTFAIILLFILLIMRLIVVGERQKSDFGKYFAYCVAGIFFIHFFVNIGMTMGLLPIIGIPLPLISKGGSSLVGFTLLVGILLKIDSSRFSS